MSDVSQGDGWWEASDGKWYPPERHPDYTAPTQGPAPAMPTPQPPLVTSSSIQQEPLESPQTAPSAFAAPLAASGLLPGSVKGWKPVRRKRIDDRLALRKGALVGLAVAIVSLVIYAAVRDLLSGPYGYSAVFSILVIYDFRFEPPFSQPPFVLLGLFVAALVAGWLVARAATNSRAGLSAVAAFGSVFVASVVVAFTAMLFEVLTNLGAEGVLGGYLFGSALRILVAAGFCAAVALPFGIIGWLIGRPRPLSVAATASINLNQTAASDELMLVLSGLRNQRVERPTLSTVSLRLRFFPGWAILLSLLLFPLGILAAIAAQREETGTIILNEAGQDSSMLQVRGLFDEAACTRIEAFLKQHAASTELS
jgi:hypothetical protein